MVLDSLSLRIFKWMQITNWEYNRRNSFVISAADATLIRQNWKLPDKSPDAKVIILPRFPDALKSLLRASHFTLKVFYVDYKESGHPI